MISVVVCTYNRSDVLQHMLESFFAQACLDTIDHELLVVDNNSSDDTRKVVERFSGHPTLRYLFEPRQGLSCARNRGVTEARGEIISFLDDDVTVDAHWLENIKKCFDETHADVVGGRSYLIFATPPPRWLQGIFRMALAEVNLGDSRIFQPSATRLYGLNLSFRTTALTSCGTFSESLGRKGSQLLSGEETAMIRHIQELGGIVVYEPNAIVGHIMPPDRSTWSYFSRHSVGTGRTWARFEAPGGLLVRLRRVLTAFYRLLRSALVLVVKLPTGSYGRRLALSRLYTSWGLVAERLNYLFRTRAG